MKQKIRAAIESRLNTWASGQSLPIAWEDRPFTPPAGMHLRVWMMPADTDDPALGSTLQRHEGIYQVSIYAASGAGTGALEIKAGLLATEFKRGTVMTFSGTRVTIDQTPSIGQARPDGAYTFVPVLIRYRADIFA